MVRSASATPRYFFACSTPVWVINRVFATSNGVVAAADTAPALEPSKQFSQSFKSSRCVLAKYRALQNSYVMNWSASNGISRASMLR